MLQVGLEPTRNYAMASKTIVATSYTTRANKMLKNKCYYNRELFICQIHLGNLERGKRIELSASAWKAEVLPLYEPRTLLECTLFHSQSLSYLQGVYTF